MTPGTRMVLAIAYDALLIFLMLGCVFALAFGIALVLGRSWPQRLNAHMNRWISTRQAMRGMEMPRDVHRPLYRRHRWVGFLLSVGAAYVLYVLIARYNAAPILAYFARHVRPGVASWLLDWFRLFVIVTNGFALLFGLTLFFRPSLLKGVEAWANRSYSGRPATKSLEIMHFGVDRAVVDYPRLSGSLITVGSLCALVSFAMLLLVGAR